jgi:hypothetical protein
MGSELSIHAMPFHARPFDCARLRFAPIAFGDYIKATKSIAMAAVITTEERIKSVRVEGLVSFED